MFDLIKKTMLTGVGLAGLTKDKIEKLAKELAKKGKLSEKEGKKLVDDKYIEEDESCHQRRYGQAHRTHKEA